ncbi:MAG: ECF transporter S component, partial [Candidatus Zixiibacteriota bacterium]
MNSSIRLIPRIALFSALIYVLSWGTIYLPNINFVFFIVFSAGFMWGALPGILVGAIGMGLWTLFNPYGPAPFPIMLVQVGSSSLSGLVGAFLKNKNWQGMNRLLLSS